MLRGRQVRASVVPHLGALEQLGFLARSMCFEGSNTCTSRPNPASRTIREREITQAVVGTGTLCRARSLRKSNSKLLQDRILSAWAWTSNPSGKLSWGIRACVPLVPGALHLAIHLAGGVATARGSRRLRRLWEGHSDAVLKNDGSVLIRHALVHDGAVAVTLHMRLKPLVWFTPAHSAKLFAPYHPVGIATEFGPEVRDIRRIHQVHEGIAHASPRPKVDRQVQEVVLSFKALFVEQRKNHGAIVVVG
mmetsp:Transcript_41985/g.100078  ORF Transcript_41985/g.100078 Transcript_41985/m.100078 type:complete len:249 (-) Transcript_41985:200-946(-)